jgi:hypothetical protein
VEDTASIKKAWQQLPDKRRAYFLAYQTEGLGFVIIKTLVTALEYRVPTQNTVGHFSPAELS